MLRRSPRRDHYDVVFYSPWMSTLLAPGAGPPPGGAETQIRALAEALAARGLRVALVVDSVPGLPETTAGVAVVAQPRPSLPPPLRALARIALAWRTLSRTPGAVYVQRAAGTVTALVALHARAHRRRFVFSAANVTDFAWERLEPSRLRRALYRGGLRLARDVVAQTEEQAALCREALGRDALVIRSIARLPAVADPTAPEAFAWLGRVEEPKNPRAYIRLARALPEARFRMVAVTPTDAARALLEDLRPEIEALPNLELLPARPAPELDPIYRSAVAVVSTSLGYEGMPNVLLEGWARGVPALVLRDDPDGIVARHGLGWVAGGDEELLATLARSAWAQRERDVELGERVQTYVRDHHDPDQVAATWERLLRGDEDAVRVLEVLTQDAVGGTELMVTELIPRLDRAHVDAELAVFGDAGPISEALAGRGVRVHVLGRRTRALRRLARLVRGGRYDIVHAYGFKVPMVARVLVRAVARDTRFLVGVQSVVPAEADPGSVKGRMTLWLDRCTSALIDRYEANSRGALRRLELAGIPPEKLCYIPNGIDLTGWAAPRPERAGSADPVVSCVGRFIPRKRQADLVRAVALLRQREIGCRLVLAGDGPSLERVRTLARELDVDEVVEFRGLLSPPEVRDLLAESDVYAQPSLYEGMPASVLEAMASGLPVVGTRANGIEDLIVDGETGLLVSVARPDEIAAALARLFADPDEGRRMGARGRERAADVFDLDHVVRAKTELFVELATSRRA